MRLICSAPNVLDNVTKDKLLEQIFSSALEKDRFYWKDMKLLRVNRTSDSKKRKLAEKLPERAVSASEWVSC